jgi:hypothetical protein
VVTCNSGIGDMLGFRFRTGRGVPGAGAKVTLGLSEMGVIGERQSWTVPVLRTVRDSKKRWFPSDTKSEVDSISSVWIMLLYELE